MPDSEIPLTGTAQVHILHEGYAREADGQEHVGSTVTLIVDDAAVIVVDPGPDPGPGVGDHPWSRAGFPARSEHSPVRLS